jgi:hypothetical protein
MNLDHAGGRARRKSSVIKEPSAADPQDRAWETELVSLIGSLEGLRNRLQEHFATEQGILALDTMLELVEVVSNFAALHAARQPRTSAKDGLVHASLLRELDDRIDSFRAVAGKLRNRLSKSPWHQLLRLFRPAPEHEDPHAQFLASVKELFEVLTTAFDLFTGQFRTLAAARNWNETRKVFLSDLRQLIKLQRS